MDQKTFLNKQLQTALNEATSDLNELKEQYRHMRNNLALNSLALDEREKVIKYYEGVEKAKKEDIRKLRDEKSLVENESQKLSEENERLRLDLQQQIQESEENLMLKEQEMMAEFESEWRKREHEFNLKLDEKNNDVLSNELKVQRLSREMKALVTAHRETIESMQEQNRQAQSEISQKERDLKSTITTKEKRIKELEGLQEEMARQCKKDLDSWNRKHAELERWSRGREVHWGVLKEAHVKELQEVKLKASELQDQLDGLILDQQGRAKSHVDDLHRRDQEINELKKQMEKARSDRDAYIFQITKQKVATETKLLASEDREAKVRSEMQMLKEDFERYKQMKREEELEQKRVQPERFLSGEELLQTRNHASAVNIRRSPSEELKRLQQQNNSFKVLISEMKTENEDLKKRLSSQQQASALTISGATPEKLKKLQQRNNSLVVLLCEMLNANKKLKKKISSLMGYILPGFAGDLQEVNVTTSAAAEATQELRLAEVRSTVEHLAQQNASTGGGLVEAGLLRSVLQRASRIISDLRQNRETLVGMNNDLRARLRAAGLDDIKPVQNLPLTETVIDCGLSQAKKCSFQSKEALHSKRRSSAFEDLQKKKSPEEAQSSQTDLNKTTEVLVPPLFPERDNPDVPRNHHPPRSSPKVSASAGPSPFHFSSDESGKEGLGMLEIAGLSSTGVSLCGSDPDEHTDTVAAANGEKQTGAFPPSFLVCVEGTKAPLQERKTPTHTFVPVKKTFPARPKIRNYNNKD